MAAYTIDFASFPTAKFKVSRVAAANTGNNTFAAIIFDTKQYDVGNNFASGVFTVPTTGKYHFNWIVNSVLSTGTAETLIASLFVNGVEQTTGIRYTGLTVGGSTGSTDESLIAGDVVGIRVYNTSTRALIVGKEVTFSGGQML